VGPERPAPRRPVELVQEHSCLSRRVNVDNVKAGCYLKPALLKAFANGGGGMTKDRPRGDVARQLGEGVRGVQGGWFVAPAVTAEPGQRVRSRCVIGAASGTVLHLRGRSPGGTTTVSGTVLDDGKALSAILCRRQGLARSRHPVPCWPSVPDEGRRRRSVPDDPGRRTRAS